MKIRKEIRINRVHYLQLWQSLKKPKKTEWGFLNVTVIIRECGQTLGLGLGQ